MNTCYVVRSSRPAGLFSFGFLDGLPVRLCRPYLREVSAGFGLERLATAFVNNPGSGDRTDVSTRLSPCASCLWGRARLRSLRVGVKVQC